jgi:hypothetical protein
MEQQFSPYFSSNPISASLLRALANALLDLGVDQVNVKKLEEMTSAPEIYSVESLRSAVEVWVKLLKIECAHGICCINVGELNGTVMPALNKFLDDLQE